MNKKYLAIIIIILLVTAGIFGWMFWKNKIQEREKKEQAGKISQFLPGVKCDFKSDGEANAMAVNSKDLVYCSCIKDATRKEKCERGVSDVNYYEQAVLQYDASLCQNISQPSIKEACNSIVKNGIASLKQSDPLKLSYIYSQSGNYDASIEILENGLSKNPGINYMLALATDYANKGLKLHQESVYVPKALDLIEKCKQINPNLPEIYKTEGFVYEVKPDLKKAVEIYDKAISINSEYIPAYIGQGHALHMLGSFYDAQDAFEKAKSLDKDNQFPEIYSNLCLLQSTNDALIEKAVENCKIAEAAKTNSPFIKAEVLNVLSNMYMNLGKFVEAKSSLEKALIFGFDKAASYVGFATLYNKQGQYDLAVEFAQKALKEDSLKSSAYNSLSYALYKTGKTEEAIKAALSGIETVDKDPSIFAPNKGAAKKDLYYILANVYNSLGDKDNELKYKNLGDGALQ